MAQLAASWSEETIDATLHGETCGQDPQSTNSGMSTVDGTKKSGMSTIDKPSCSAVSSGETHTANQGLCDPQSILLLCVLPFCNIISFLWCYTALPLHWLDKGWPLWQLALILTLIYVPKACVGMQLLNRVGDWLSVVFAALAVVLNTWMLMEPDNLAAVAAAMTACNFALCPPAYRGFVHSRFAGSGTWQTQRALRIFIFADTMGYAWAPFVGGLLYDSGGLRACAVFTVCGHCVGAVAPLLLPEWHQSFAKTRRRCAKAQLKLSDVPLAQALPKPATAGNLPPQGQTEAAAEAKVTCRAIATPMFMILVATLTNICVYGVEWCLYAMYFRLEYGWSGAWCGFAQMVGDLLGAAMLALSTMQCAARVASSAVLPRPLRALLRPPLNLSVLAAAHAALLVMLAQRHFAVALTGQVLMGTTYVFFEQSLQELLVVYSFGDHALYRRLVSAHYLSFISGAALSSPIAYGFYELRGAETAFYASALLALVVGAGVGTYFVCRLASTSSGVLGGLTAAEQERLKARSPRERRFTGINNSGTASGTGTDKYEAACV